MKVSLTTPLTDEQQKLWDELQRVWMMITLTGSPLPCLPLESTDPIQVELGQRRMAEIQRAENERLRVLAFLLEYRLAELEAEKGK